jgi:hypothetical protein
MGFEVPAEHALTRKADDLFEVRAGVGMKGLGQGTFVHLSYAKGAIPDGVFPTAVLEFPGRVPGGPRAVVRAALTQRC